MQVDFFRQLLAPELFYILIGSVFTILGNLVVQAYRREKDRRSARRAIKGEIESGRSYLDDIVVDSGPKMPVREGIDSRLSRKMYQQNLPRLGVLSDEEVQYTLTYYQEIENLVQNYEKYNQLNEKNEGETQDGGYWQSAEDAVYPISVTVSAKSAQVARDELLPILNQKLNQPWWLSAVFRKD